MTFANGSGDESEEDEPGIRRGDTDGMGGGGGGVDRADGLVFPSSLFKLFPYSLYYVYVLPYFLSISAIPTSVCAISAGHL